MLIDDIIKQLAEAMKIKLKKEHIRFDEAADNTRIILDYLDNREKRILQKPRGIVISTELLHKIQDKDFGINSKSADDIIDDFNHICTKIRNGENLNFNLSEKIFDSREKYKDIMLNVWKIRHIHLCKNDVSSKNAMKRNRSSALLFCIVKCDTVMCLDIIEHPSSDKFFCFNLMKIVKNNNWMEKIGFVCNDDSNYVPGSLKPIIEKDEDLTQLYTECKVNSAFEFEGRIYFSLDGITRTGDTSHNIIIYQKFIKALESIIEKNDMLEEISSIIFKDQIMEFTIVIARDAKRIKYQCQL